MAACDEGSLADSGPDDTAPPLYPPPERPRVRVRQHALEVDPPNVDPVVVRRVLDMILRRHEVCFQDALRRRRQTPAEGRVSVEFRAANSGATDRLRLHASTFADSELNECIVRGYSGMALPSEAKGFYRVVDELSFQAELPPARAPTSGDAVWSRRLGGIGEQSSRGVALLDGDEIAVLGDFVGQAKVGSERLVATDRARRALFVTWLRADGTARLAKEYGEFSEPHGGAFMAAAPEGDVVIATAGLFALDGRPGPGALADGGNEGGGSLIRLDRHGQPRWIRSLPMAQVTGVAVGASGRIAVVGTSRVAGEGGSPSEEPTRRTNIVREFGPEGEPRWTTALTFDGVPKGTWLASNFLASSLAIDAEGRVFTAGSADGPPSSAPDSGLARPKTPATRRLGVVASLRADGSTSWVATLVAGGVAQALTVPAGDTSRIIVGGSVECDGEAAEGVLVAIDASSGAAVWHRRLGRGEGALSDIVSLAIDPLGRVAYAGAARTMGSGFVVGVSSPDGGESWGRFFPFSREKGAFVAAAATRIVFAGTAGPGADDSPNARDVADSGEEAVVSALIP